MIKPEQDAHGQLVADHFAGKEVIEIVERDDGLIDASQFGPAIYFAEHKDWPKFERQAIRYARGRVLDVGCGAVRVALYLQTRGHDVLAIDNSPLAVKVCRKRGVKCAKVLSITQITRKLGVFDTIVMFGNNFGLFGGPRRARWLLRKFYRLTSDQGIVIAQSADPYLSKLPEHTSYHKFNRRRGRMAGELRLRIRHRKTIGPWFDYLIVSQTEMESLLEDTGWSVRRFIDSGKEWGAFPYCAIIDKQKR
jgi:SAM-dependent methyltransferase